MHGLIPFALLLLPAPAAPAGDGLHAAARELVAARRVQAERRSAAYAALAADEHVPRVWADRVAAAARDLARLDELLAAEPDSGGAVPGAAIVRERGGVDFGESAPRSLTVAAPAALLARHRARLTARAAAADADAAAWGERARRLSGLVPTGAASPAERDAATAAAAVARGEAAFARARLRLADRAAAGRAAVPFGFAPDGTEESDLLVGAGEVRLAVLALTARAAAAREAAAAGEALAARLRPLVAGGAASPAEVSAARRAAAAARSAAGEAAAAADFLADPVFAAAARLDAGPAAIVPVPPGFSPLAPLGG